MTQTAFFGFVAPQVVLAFEKNQRSPSFGWRIGGPVGCLSSLTMMPRRSLQLLESRLGPAEGAPATGVGILAGAGALPPDTVTGVWTATAVGVAG
jgi:hypothetical protein